MRHDESIVSADKGEHSMFLGQREICLKIFCLAAISCSKLFQSMAVLGTKDYLQRAVFVGSTL